MLLLAMPLSWQLPRITLPDDTVASFLLRVYRNFTSNGYRYMVDSDSYLAFAKLSRSVGSNRNPIKEHGMATFCKAFTKATVRYFEHADAAEAREWLADA
jgi:hypothetical protein